jgi:hypothetical protein
MTRAAVGTVSCLILLGVAAGCDPPQDGPPAPPTTPASPGSITSDPLADADPAAEGPLFERLGGELTGIDFVIETRSPQEFDEQMTINAIGGGAAIGDFDGDGRPDLFLTRPHGGNKLYRNLGGWKFEDVTERAGLAESRWGAGASFADIDNDGDLDLAVCGVNVPNRLYLNNGDGTFTERAQEYGLDFNGYSTMIAFADYDRDGRLDAYLLTSQRILQDFGDRSRQFVEMVVRSNKLKIKPGFEEIVMIIEHPPGEFHLRQAGQRDRLYHNEGNGKFREVAESAGLSGNDVGLGVVWWDFDEDGWPDLYVANDISGPDRLWRNNRDGTFTHVAPVAFGHVPFTSMGVDAGDVNNDGKLDLITTDMAGTDHFKAKVGMGQMGGSQAWELTWGEPRQASQNALFINSGTERFLEAAAMAGVAASDWTWAARLLDLDNDGRLDLFFTNGMIRFTTHSDRTQEQNRLMDAAPLSQRERVYLDYWRDKPVKTDKNLAFRNLGDLRFEEVGRAWGLDLLGVSFAAAAGDFDGDGSPDLVVTNYQDQVALYRNRAGGHRVKIALRGTRSNRFGIGARLDLKAGPLEQVRELTLARGYLSADEPVVHFGLGEQTKIERLRVAWPSGHVQEFADLAADRFYTITEPGGPPPPPARRTEPPPLFARSTALRGIRHLEKPFDDFAHQSLLPNKLSQLGPGLAIGDVNGDGLEDIFMGGAAGSAGRIFLNTGGSGLRLLVSPQVEWHRDFEDMSALLFDADGDGRPDLYVVSGSNEFPKGDSMLRDHLYLNDGRGRFELAPEGTMPDLRDAGSCVTAADFDGDGDLDLFVGGRLVPREYPACPESRLLRNDGGRFVDATDELAPGLKRAGMVTGALWSDVNGDGRPDLLLTVEYGPIRLFGNEGGRLVERTKEAGLDRLTGWWNGIAGRDLDNDGDIDYVVTNFGLNTKYHASPERPTLLFAKDFDRDGTADIVEAVYEGAHLFPVRGWSCSSRAMPMVAVKCPSFEAFGRAILEEIYELEGALRLEAATLESGVLINDGTGRFTFHPLPRLAQTSPAFGVALTDADGDGLTDIVLAQNFFTPQPETARMDGGVSLLLLGRGGGRFEPVRPDRSGIVVPGDAKSLVVTDLNGDGREDLIFGINDGELMTFENRSTQNRRFEVRLKGKPGNPTAVGARVTLELSDGTKQTAEVAAGSGYLSQSSPRLVFGLGTSNAPARVHVRWPDGTLSAHDVTGGTASCEPSWPR